VWPARAERVEQVEARLRDPDSWLLMATEGGTPVGMTCSEPLRGEGRTGPVVLGGVFLNLIYVLPERWGEGIGGILLDAVVAEARRRGSAQIRLWTDEEDNERAKRLYASRGFAPTGRVAGGAGEWALEL
jgi:GNAT superfamily N-acetyltransferase